MGNESNTHSLWPPDTQLCVWMQAGLLSYRLCDRAFDCEHCPLDAALRGTSVEHQSELEDSTFPCPHDRRYASCHSWALRTEGGAIRIGIDSFAAALVGSVRAVSLPPKGAKLQQGDVLAQLDLGIGKLPIKSPVRGRVVRCNPRANTSPSLVVTAPYDEGWLVELSGDARQLRRLISSTEIRYQLRDDLRRFRRQVATQLLVGTEGLGPLMGDGGERLTNLRQILGARRYLALISTILS